MASSSFDCNGDENWNGCELSTEYDQATSPLQLQDCWECRCCGRINNLNKTMKNPKLKCDHCPTGRYNPEKMKLQPRLGSDSKQTYKIANELEKQLLTKGFIKRQKVWPCNFCNYDNSMFESNCLLCNNIRPIAPVCYYKNKIAKWNCYGCNREVLNATECPDCHTDINPQLFGWQCKICEKVHGKEMTSICDGCKFRKPTSFCWKTYQRGADELIEGYCKDNTTYIFPVYLVEIVKQYYIIILPTKKLKILPTISDPKDGIYILHYKIQKKKSYYRKMKNDITIGLKEVIDDNSDQIPLEYLLNDDSREIKRYCQKITFDNIISMELDYMNGTLSFGIDNSWFGTFATINREKKYEFYCESGNTKIELIQMKIISRKEKEDPKPLSTKIKGIIAMADEVDIVSTDMIKEALLSNDETVKDTMIMTLLATLEELQN